MAGLTREDVAHVAHLARLGLTEEELSLLAGQLNHILDQYGVLAELQTDHIPPTAQTIEVEGVMRDDVVTPSLAQEEVLAQAPDRQSAYFRVPVVVGGAEDAAPVAENTDA